MKSMNLTPRVRLNAWNWSSTILVFVREQCNHLRSQLWRISQISQAFLVEIDKLSQANELLSGSNLFELLL